MSEAKHLFFTDQGLGSPVRPRRIVRCDIDGKNPTQLAPITTNTPRGCWYNPNDEHVYWVDLLDNELWKVKAEAEKSIGTKVATIEGSPTCLTGDVVNNVLYYTDTNGGRIYKVNPDGTDNLVLATGIPSPFGATFRPSARILYFSSIGAGKIQGLKVDLGFIHDVVTSGLTIPGDVDIDLSSGTLIYCDQADDKIKSVEFTGANETVLLDDPSKLNITFLTVDGCGEKLYFQDSEAMGNIFVCRIDGSFEQVLLSDSDFPIGVVQGICTDAILPSK